MKAQKQQQQRGGNGPRPMFATYTLTGQELYVVGQDQPLNITLPSATGELVVVSPIIEVCGGVGGRRSVWMRSYDMLV